MGGLDTLHAFAAFLFPDLDRGVELCLRLQRGCGVRAGGVMTWERGAWKGREGAAGVDVGTRGT